MRNENRQAVIGKKTEDAENFRSITWLPRETECLEASAYSQERLTRRLICGERARINAATICPVA